MEQLSIFEESTGRSGSPVPAAQLKPPPRARREDPETSKLAAAQVDDFSNAHYALIRKALAGVDGATCHELAALTELDHVQVARRLKEMQGIYPTAETRPGPSGRPCRIWKRK